MKKKQSRSKILLILHIPPPFHGSSVVGALIKNSKIINESFNCDYINLSTSRSIDEIGKNGIHKFITYFAILFNVFKKLLVNRYDLGYIAITSKGIAFYKDMIVVGLLKLFRVKVVHHMHNKGVALRQDKSIDNFLYRFVFNNSRVILLSKYLYPDIQKYVKSENVFYCPNGILKAKDDHNYNKSINNSVEILFLTNLIESKGVYVLLEALGLLKKNNISFHCTLVGGEGDINAIQLEEKIKSLTVEEEVSYLGSKYGVEKTIQLIKSDIFVLPTYSDCFPLVLLEAMSFGLPVVSTYEGGIPDIIVEGETGFLVPPKDAKALADNLEILIRNPVLRKQMGIAGQTRYEQNFTLQHFETNLNDILNKILNEG